MDQQEYAPAMALNRRMVRRDIHRSRAATSVGIGIIAIASLAWVGTEIVLHLAGRPALLASPLQMADWLTGVPENTVPWGLILAGIGLLLIGLLLLIVAIGSGHRPRRALDSNGDRNAIVVDDSVVAAALANVARNTARVQPDQVMVRVSKRTAAVDIRPTTGVPVDGDIVLERLNQEVATWRLPRELKVKVKVGQEGAVGA
ncbi:hypothetical protein [Acaricomes phytoseiuli]|uniref:hypothetical protein n=1 Tax=Acaricomes phytoseiuli TaxID=291968 RepID=UPI000365269F|nr:hypothetical protein [Acaricomes phytoseiuli]